MIFGTMGPPRVQFIMVSSNTPKEAARSGTQQRKLAHSHAARSAHAKARHLRTIQYQAQKRSAKQSDPAEKCVEEGFPMGPKSHLIRILSADRKDPFMSFATPLKPVEEMLFDHCMYTFLQVRIITDISVDVTVIIPLMRCEEPTLEFTERMTRTWVPFARTDASLLDIIFLLSSRHLSAINTQSQQRSAYTQRALHL
jgi:hypothetical protein